MTIYATQVEANRDQQGPDYEALFQEVYWMIADVYDEFGVFPEEFTERVKRILDDYEAWA